MLDKNKNILCFASRLSQKQWIMVGFALLLVWFVASIFVPFRTTYSYAAKTCSTHLVVWPSIRQSPKDAKFTVSYEGGVRLVGKHILASKSCIVARTAPVQGIYSQRSSPFGLPFATVYRVEVPAAPGVKHMPAKAEIAVTKPLKVTLNSPDTVHEYYVSSDSQRQKCTVLGLELQCGINKLGLSQGAEYELAISRSFATEKPVELSRARVMLLPAIAITSQTIQPQEKVYSTPKELVLTTDKELTSAVVTVLEIDGNTSTPVAARTELRGRSVALVFAADLPREKTFAVQFNSAQSADGTTLSAPYEYRFSTSGGPKVSHTNIGPNSVSQGMMVRIVFDQPLAKGQDIARYVRVEGVTGVATYAGNEARITLNNAPKCAAFTLVVSSGLIGENGLASKTSWSYGSRISCRTTTTIGSSLKGRPITAYYYGSGSATILFTGGIHGTEASGSYILKDWITHLDANAYKIPAGRQVVVIPDTNPDGLAAGTRDNARGVNIDRNFPTSNWKTDINSSNGFRPGGGGTAPASEPETQALMNITSQLRPRLEVSYHAQGSIVGASACSASTPVARSYANAVGYRTMIGTAEEVMGYELTGEYEEWICEAYGTPAILIELPNRTGRFLSSHLNTMWQMVRY